ncbi:MAG: glycine zipper 2TM domain-containing protein [Lysobacter sp.]|nr:MAG: glycine zipper 2TM domain-containing protein [Lysobacter sp.]
MQTLRILAATALLSSLAFATDAQAARCYNKVVYRAAPVKDPHRITGTAIGAVVGGLVGHQVGGGKGRDLATVGGAVAGGVAGHKIQRHRQERGRREVIRVCQ